MELRVIDDDPEQSGRVREWLAEHEDFEFFRDRHHRIWRLSNGEREFTGSSLRDLFRAVDAVIAGGPPPPVPRGYGPPPKPSRRLYLRPGPPDIIA